MPLSRQSKVLMGCLLSGLLALMLISVFALTRPQRDIPRNEAAQAETAPAGFSFFDIRSDTILSRRLRENLADQLGPDAIARRDLIDLVIIDEAFTQTHFPQIYNYHRDLNPAFGVRREHAVTTLTYRRARLEGLPFKLIRLVFDQRTGNPLYLIVEPTGNDPGLFATLEDKWGVPTRHDGSREGNHALVWRKPDEILAGVSIRRRGGRIERQVRIYFMANIGDLVEQVRAANEAQRRQTDKAKQRAF